MAVFSNALLEVSQWLRVDVGAGTHAVAKRYVTSCGYLLVGFGLIFFSPRDEHRLLDTAGVLVLCGGALLAWLACRKRALLVGDTPTSQLRSAPQGYVELEGRCELLPGALPLSFGRLSGCVWYSAVITEHEQGFLGRRNARIYTRSSDETFALVDSTGECVIDPDGAQVLSSRVESWRVGDTSYRVSYLRPGEPLYALGELRTQRGADDVPERKSDLNALLREWKKDRGALLARFDHNGDGDIDLAEWESAVAAAEQVVAKEHLAMRLQPDIHLLVKPKDRRPFLLSNRDPNQVATRFRIESWFHAAVLASSIGAGLAAWL